MKQTSVLKSERSQQMVLLRIVEHGECTWLSRIRLSASALPATCSPSSDLLDVPCEEFGAKNPMSTPYGASTKMRVA
uniref:Uncharacterized protein n=1 Tax=Arundo donax TaxID=35708 RepID=A0A0A9APM6_ARUDO